MGKRHNTGNHNTQKSQEASPFQAGDHRAPRNRQDSKTKKHIQQKGSTKEASPWNGPARFIQNTCEDPEGETGGPDPLKNHKNIGFSSSTSPDPLKNRSSQASIQCWAIIGPPAKRHLMLENGVKLAYPHELKKKPIKVGPPLKKKFWTRTCKTIRLNDKRNQRSTATI